MGKMLAKLLQIFGGKFSLGPCSDCTHDCGHLKYKYESHKIEFYYLQLSKFLGRRDVE